MVGVGSIDEVTFLYRRHGARCSSMRVRAIELVPAAPRKHAELYDERVEAELAAESDLGALGRAVYRWWWGARPLPARVEGALQSLLWRSGSLRLTSSSRPAT